jgi:hypothetical protein
VLVHPVVASHTSAVHSFPSSQLLVTRLPHCPVWQVLACDHTSPSQDDATHVTPSVRLLQPRVARAMSHFWQPFVGCIWPFVRHVPSIRQLPATSAFPQPVAAVQVSAVQVLPSSQFDSAPPPVHCPVTHVLAAFHESPVQVLARHTVPSPAFDHDVVLVPGVQTRHGLVGFACASAKHCPSMRHVAAFNAVLHPAATSHTSVVHVLPSSHDCSAPPPEHCPDAHVRGLVHESPTQAPARH